MRWGLVVVLVILGCDSHRYVPEGTVESQTIRDQYPPTATPPAPVERVEGRPAAPSAGDTAAQQPVTDLGTTEEAFPRLIDQAPKRIPVRVSSQMWTPVGLRPTSPELIDMVRSVMGTWERAIPGLFVFEYQGLTDVVGDDGDSFPDDGALTIVFTGAGAFSSPLVAGVGRFRGELPATYRKGYVFMNPRTKGRRPFGMSTLLHETGHALGFLGHVPTPGAVMSCGSKGWVGDYEFLSEQDRVDVLHAWYPDAVWSISGQVSGEAFPYVFAVDGSTGRTYSAVGDRQGHFLVPIARPGRYLVFAKSFESSKGSRQATVAPSWYVKPGASSNDPKQGHPLVLDQRTHHIDGVEFPIQSLTVPFNLFWSVTHVTRDGSPFIPSFLAPGERVRFQLIENGGRIESIEAFGEHPDIQFSDLSYVPASGDHFVVVEAHHNAGPGHRLVLARGAGNVVQAGLIGVHVVHPADRPKKWSHSQ